MKQVTSETHLSHLSITGYKSIAKCEMEMGALNVLIGANGAGKSNFISFFKLIATVLDEKLQHHVSKAGGPDTLLHFGRKTTEQLQVAVICGENGYQFQLEPTNDNRMMFAHEALWWEPHGDWRPKSGHFESVMEEQKHKTRIYDFTVPRLRQWRVYHFHDTSDSAKVKQIHRINDNAYLREDGANLAAFLYRLKHNHESHYKRIVKTIQMVAPFFGDFYLRATANNADSIQLEWTEKQQDIPFKSSELSDGTLRFILLATVLLQPEDYMPGAIIVDEPELGLHPYAIAVLAGLLKSASHTHQLIISTQSVELVNEFDAEDLIVVDKQNGASAFNRLNEDELAQWLEDYSLGELWTKNLLGGRPQR